MLGWSLAFFIVALLAGCLGLGGVAVAAAWVAQVLVGVFLGLFLTALVVDAVGRSPGGDRPSP